MGAFLVRHTKVQHSLELCPMVVLFHHQEQLADDKEKIAEVRMIASCKMAENMAEMEGNTAEVI